LTGDPAMHGIHQNIRDPRFRREVSDTNNHEGPEIRVLVAASGNPPLIQGHLESRAAGEPFIGGLTPERGEAGLGVPERCSYQNTGRAQAENAYQGKAENFSPLRSVW
jgi:hypothetical protein